MKKLFKLRILVPILVLLAVIAAIISSFRGDKSILPSKITDTPKPLQSIAGSGSNALNRPLAVTVSPQGWVYVSDSDNNRVEVFKANGKFIFSFGQAGTGDGQFNFPYGLVVLPDGKILVSDMQNHRIQQFSADGKFEKVLLSAQKGIKPGELYWQDSVLYVADLNSHNVVAMNLDGNIIRYYRANMNFPQGIASVDGKLVVADAGNKMIRMFTLEGKSVGSIDGTAGGQPGLAVLRGVAVDNLNRILAVDALTGQVRFMTLAGKNLVSIGGLGNGMNQLQYPAGIFIDSKGKIYVADWANNRIQVWGYTK